MADSAAELKKKLSANKRALAKARKEVQRLERNRKRFQAALKRANKPKYGVTGTIGPAPGFNWSEVNSKDGTRVPAAYKPNVVVVANNVNKLRARVKRRYDAEQVSILVLSAYRSPRHNANVGGVSNSQHLTAKAFDIRVMVKVDGKWFQVPPAVVGEVAAQVDRFAKGGIGVYGPKSGNFTHVDIRPGKARWSKA